MESDNGNATSALYLNRTLLRKAAKANFSGCCSKDCASERAMLRRDATSLAQALKVLYDLDANQMKTLEAMSELVNGLCVDFGIPKRQACTGVDLQTLSSSLKVADKYASSALGKVEPASGGETFRQTSSARDATGMVNFPTLPSQTQKWQNHSSLTRPPLKRPRYAPAQNGYTNGALPLHAAKASTSNNSGTANGLLNGIRRDEMSPTVSLGSRSDPAEGTPLQRRVEAIAGTSSSSASNFNTNGPWVVCAATATLVAQRGGESDCNLYRDCTKLYLSVSPIKFDTRMHALPLPRLRSNLQLLTPTAPKIHALKTEVVYDNEYCNLQVTVEFDYQPDVEQMIHLAYYLKSGSGPGEDHNKWVHHPPFKCTCRGGDGRMSLTIRFKDSADEFEMIMISVRMNSGHLGTTQFTPPVVVRLGRPLAGRSVVNADIDFFLHHLPSVDSATEGTGNGSANNFSTREEVIFLD